MTVAFGRDGGVASVGPPSGGVGLAMVLVFVPVAEDGDGEHAQEQPQRDAEEGPRWQGPAKKKLPNREDTEHFGRGRTPRLADGSNGWEANRRGHIVPQPPTPS